MIIKNKCIGYYSTLLYTNKKQLKSYLYNYKPHIKLYCYIYITNSNKKAIIRANKPVASENANPNMA